MKGPKKGPNETAHWLLTNDAAVAKYANSIMPLVELVPSRLDTQGRSRSDTHPMNMYTGKSAVRNAMLASLE